MAPVSDLVDGVHTSLDTQYAVSQALLKVTASKVVIDALQAIDKLSGQWKLLYTVNSELTGLLGLGRLPGIEVGEISQSVNALTLSITNTVTIGGPISRTAFSAKAAFEIMSPKRIQVGALPTLCAALPGNSKQ